MAFPNEALTTLRPDLGAAVIEFNAAIESQGFIASQVLPVIEVPEKKGTYGLVPLKEVSQGFAGSRAPGSGYGRVTSSFGDASYACQDYGAEYVLDDNDAAAYRNYFDGEVFGAQVALLRTIGAYEKRVADAIFSTSTWTGANYTTAVSNEWDDAHNATPITDVRTAVKKIRDRCGMIANTIVMDWEVFQNLIMCQQIQDAIKADGAGDPAKVMDINVQKIAEVFGIPKVLVSGAIYNSANYGQSKSLSSIWDDEYVWIGVTAETNLPQEACVGRTFHWSADGSQIGGTFETYREEDKRSTIIRCRHETDEVIYTNGADCGHLLSNITS